MRQFETVADMNAATLHYEIVDIQTGQVVAVAKTGAGALRACDRRDAAYGAHRYTRRRVFKS